MCLEATNNRLPWLCQKVDVSNTRRVWRGCTSETKPFRCEDVAKENNFLGYISWVCTAHAHRIVRRLLHVWRTDANLIYQKKKGYRKSSFSTSCSSLQSVSLGSHLVKNRTEKKLCHRFHATHFQSNNGITNSLRSKNTRNSHFVHSRQPATDSMTKQKHELPGRGERKADVWKRLMKKFVSLIW